MRFFALFFSSTFGSQTMWLDAPCQLWETTVSTLEIEPRNFLFV